MHRAHVGNGSVQIWDSSDLENPEAQPKPTRTLDGALASEIEHIVGAFGTRMIVYTKDHWIASVDLQAPTTDRSGLSEQHHQQNAALMRQFLISNDCVTIADHHKSLVFGVGRAGEVLFARRSELAVIRRGLEVTEFGASFNPRRVNSGQLGLRTSSLSVRNRSRSPDPSLRSTSSGALTSRPLQRLLN